MTKDNEDALRRADELSPAGTHSLAHCGPAAAHLRRLVRENEFLSRALAARNSEVVHAAQQLNAKDALLRQAEEALGGVHAGEHQGGVVEAIVAIRQHLDQKTT